MVELRLGFEFGLDRIRFLPTGWTGWTTGFELDPTNIVLNTTSNLTLSAGLELGKNKTHLRILAVNRKLNAIFEILPFY